MIHTVVLAAGAGTRLGGVAKALLRAGEQTYLQRIAKTAGGNLIVVVGPPFGDVVSEAAAALGARVVVNPAPERGMASSVALGFGALTGGDAAWLWPVDHPFVEPATLRSLEAAIGNHDVARPRFEGRGGHPPLIARRAWGELAGCAEVEGGARTVLGRLDVIEVVVQDRGVVRDIDTPEDAA